MKSKNKLFICLLFIGILLLFFYKTVFKGYVPIPGDLLVSEYNPWKTYSYLGYVPGSYPTKVQYFDTIRQIYPWKSLVISLIKQGQIPLWNPYNFSGTPLMANFQSAVFYPLNIVYLFCSQIAGWTILIMLQTFLASIFTYMFCRKIGIGKIGSILSSIAFSYSLFMSVFLEYNTIGHVILWIPLLLFLFERSLEKLSGLEIILFSISLAFSVFAGHFQIFGFVLIFVLIYIFARIFFLSWKTSKKVKHAGLFMSLIILSIGISAIQLIPGIELIGQSARNMQSYSNLLNNLLIQPQQLILFLSPDFFGNPATRNYLLPDSYPGNAIYIGIIPFIFALIGILELKKNYHVLFFATASLLILLFITRNPVSAVFYHIQIPLFSTSSPNNAIFLLTFFLSMLAGFGMNSWVNQKKNIHQILGLISCVFMVVWIGISIFHWRSNFNNFILSTFIFFIFVILILASNYIKNKKSVFAFLFIAVSVLDLFYYFQKFNPFVPQDLIFPKTDIFSTLYKNSGINRFWGYGTAAVEPNFQTQYFLFSPDGYDPLYPKRYGEFIQSTNQGLISKVFNNQNRSDAVIAGGYGELDFSTNKYRIKVLDLLGVKHILDRIENGSTIKTFPSGQFSLIYQKEGWRIFNNLEAAQRAFLTTDYKVFKTDKEFEEIFFSGSFNPAKTVLLEEDINIPVSNKENKSNIKFTSYSANTITLNTYSDITSLLFISDTYYPGWKAYIDGTSSRIYRADYDFRSIIVPKGNHVVVFNYEPESFYLGIKITIISILSLILFVFVLKRKKSFVYEK